MHRSRRTASPVRVSLNDDRGSDIDGAWWPGSASIARQLPDLIQALHPTLGDIIDIDINWSANSPTPMLSTMSPDIAAKYGGSAPQHRLMFLTSHSALTKLLVVPSMTSSPLALMVLRQAGNRHIPEAEHVSKEYQAAERVICAARSESALWAATRAGKCPVGPLVKKNEIQL
jgi:hypothetical protein